MTNGKGYFIAVEGGEGSGKSTLVKMLGKELTSLGYNVLTTRAPGGTDFGMNIRTAILHPQSDGKPLSSKAALLAMLADRVQQISEVINPALDKGFVVISDRFHVSSIAYQGAAQGLGVDYVMDLSRRAHGDTWPDKVIIVDVPVSVGKARVIGRGLVNSYDKLRDEFHQNVRDAYLQYAADGNPNCTVVDGSVDIDTVFRETMATVLAALSKK